MGQLVSPSIVGRKAELADLGEALTAARDGHGRVVITSGEAGIGKSRLAREVTERAREAGDEGLGRARRAHRDAGPVPPVRGGHAVQSAQGR